MGIINSPVLNTTSDIDEDMSSPPLVAGFTSGLDKDQWLSALGHGDSSGEGDLQTDLIVKAGELFARAAEEDPALLMNILSMGEAIVKSTMLTQSQQNPPMPATSNPVPVNPQMIPPMPGGVPPIAGGDPALAYSAIGQSVPPVGPSPLSPPMMGPMGPMGGPPMPPPSMTPF